MYFYKAIGWFLVVLSAAILGLTFPRPGGPPLAPALVGLFGWLFAVLMLAAELSLVVWLRSIRGIILVIACAILGMLLAWLGVVLDMFGYYAEHDVSLVRQILTGGASAAGLALGAALIRQWITKRPSPEPGPATPAEAAQRMEP